MKIYSAISSCCIIGANAMTLRGPLSVISTNMPTGGLKQIPKRAEATKFPRASASSGKPDAYQVMYEKSGTSVTSPSSSASSPVMHDTSPVMHDTSSVTSTGSPLKGLKIKYPPVPKRAQPTTFFTGNSPKGMTISVPNQA